VSNYPTFSYRTLDPPLARVYPIVFGSFRLKHITTIVYNSPLVSRTEMQNDRLGRLSETELTLCSEHSLYVYNVVMHTAEPSTKK